MKNPSTLTIVLIITASMVIGFLLGIMPVQTDAPEISIKTDDYWRVLRILLNFHATNCARKFTARLIKRATTKPLLILVSKCKIQCDGAAKV